MARNKIQDLRDHLFEVIEKLQDGDMQIETAKTIAEVGQVIINSAKVECDFMKVLGMDSSFSGFIPQNNDQKKLGNEQ